MKILLISLPLLLLAGCGCDPLEGRVVDTAGNPVSGANVIVHGREYGSCDGGQCDTYVTGCATSDAGGKFEADVDCATDEYSVAAQKEGYASCNSGWQEDCVLTPCEATDDPAGCLASSLDWTCIPHTDAAE